MIAVKEVHPRRNGYRRETSAKQERQTENVQVYKILVDPRGDVRDDSEFTEYELPSYGLPYLDDMLMVEFTV
jgi:hypothetical protein